MVGRVAGHPSGLGQGESLLPQHRHGPFEFGGCEFPEASVLGSPYWRRKSARFLHSMGRSPGIVEWSIPLYSPVPHESDRSILPRLSTHPLKGTGEAGHAKSP